MNRPSLPDLHPYLEEARTTGLLGPAPIAEQLEHSLGFVDLIEARFGGPAPAGLVPADTITPLRIVDLGSGGGVPGLVLAVALPATAIVLLDGSTRRADWLRTAVDGLGLSNTEVVAQRAEEFGRDPARRASFHVVTARSFGPPAVVAECAGPMLELGGLLVVSEPPNVAGAIEGKSAGEPRWPEEGVRLLGFGPATPRTSRGRHFVELDLVSQCPDRFPRRTGIPEKRPLF